MGGAARALLVERREDVRAGLEHPVQTNEVGRSAALLGGFLAVAAHTRLPLRVLELGASAGLNLRWDRYRYEAGGAAWGDPASPVRFADFFEGTAPALDVPAVVVERRGCDRAPLDPESAEGRHVLRAYVWADQLERLALLDGALAVAREVPAVVDAARAGDWLESALAEPVPGAATVVVHSIVMQYLDAAERRRVDHPLAAAGARAGRAAPLARLAMEHAGPLAEVRLTLWPGGAERVLATAGYHGRPVRWRPEGASSAP